MTTTPKSPFAKVRLLRKDGKPLTYDGINRALPGETKLDDVLQSNDLSVLFDTFGSCAILSDDSILALGAAGPVEMEADKDLRALFEKIVEKNELGGTLCDRLTKDQFKLYTIEEARKLAVLAVLFSHLYWVSAADPIIALSLANGQVSAERLSKMCAYNPEFGLVLRIDPVATEEDPLLKRVINIEDLVSQEWSCKVA